MIDENAYGLLVSYHSIEDDEYGLGEDEFTTRVIAFRDALRALTSERPPGKDLRTLELGHAFYVELAEGDEAGDLIAWLREARARLSDSRIDATAVLTHGGRWLDEASSALPSEPLRRALHAEAAAHAGLGPGLYVDGEAVEALGKTFKNAPTPLEIGDDVFYRIAR